MTSSSSSASAETQTLQQAAGLFLEASNELRNLDQSEGADIFVRLAEISKDLSNGDHSSKYPEVDELNHRAFDFLQYIPGPSNPIYYWALMDLYRYLFDEWYAEQVAQDIDRSMDWTWKP